MHVLATRCASRASRPSDSIRNLLALLVVASLFYTFRLANWSLGASEAYSALAASQSSFSGVIQQALRFDPGKPPFYQVLLHCFVGFFGSTETSLRGFSAIFALVALCPLYSLGFSMFGPETTLAAVVIWAVNPIALVLGQWARMYSLFIASVLTSMLTFWRLREHSSKRRIAAYGIATALVLYTHLCGLFFVGIQALVLTRDIYRGRRTRDLWTGLTVALALFTPFVPQEVSQTHDLLFGHWLDWIGVAHFGWSMSKIMTALLVGTAILALIFGGKFESDDSEPIRFCVVWLFTPIVALCAISVTTRPVFALRYIAPAIPALTLIIARSLDVFGGRVRNLATAGIATAFAVLFFFCKAARYEPWRDIARRVASAGTAQTVFFESPLEFPETQGRSAVDQQADADFPQGYFKVPFDYYFKGTNPRRVVNPFDSAQARRQIGSAALTAGGAWLVSGYSDLVAKAEMPRSARFRITRVLHTVDTSLYHVVALRPAGILQASHAPGDSSERN